ncbi:MAG TPA: Gfo/Idh/MocA family oxidoreductase [Verrucomicrobiae bacterium]|jgi:predicted dehydrogenase
MNRRQFIISTAALTAGVPPLTSALPRTKIRIGFLGGAHSHALEKWKTVRALDQYEPVGLCEESPQVREPFLKLGAKFLSREELFARCEVIAVESAVRDHSRDARLALEAGKHVHVEKPPAVTLSECHDLVQLAREKKLLLQTGYMWRFHPGINRAIEAAQRGWLGDVFLVRGTINTLVDAKRRPEWAEFKGGTMFELGCHLIDAVVRTLGKPEKVTPHLQRRGGDDLADNCVTVLEFAKAQAIVTSTTVQPNAFAHRFFEILGTNGTARVQPIEPPTLTFDLAKAAGPYPAGAQHIELPAYQRYRPEFTELAASIRNDKPLSFSLGTELLVQQTLLRACEML